MYKQFKHLAHGGLSLQLFGESITFFSYPLNYAYKQNTYVHMYIDTNTYVYMHTATKVNCLNHLVISYTGPYKLTLNFSPLHLLFPSPTLLLYDYIPLATAIDTNQR